MAAPARRDHRRHERLDDVDGPHQVDVDHRLPVLMGEPVDRAPRRDARDVHHHVHRGMVGVDVGGESGDRVIVGDVECAVLGHLRAQRQGVGDRRRQSLCIAVGEVQLGALCGQLQRGRAADAAGGTRQEAPFAVKAVLRHCGDLTDLLLAEVGATPYACHPQPFERVDGALGICATTDERTVLRQRHRGRRRQCAHERGQVVGDRSAPRNPARAG